MFTSGRGHKYLSSFLFFLIITISIAKAQVSTNSQLDYSPLTTAVPFVILSADPKTGGFGNAGISCPANVNSTFWNIAKASHIEEKYVASINYTPLLVNLKIDNYALLTFTNTYKFANSNALSLFGRYLNIKAFEITDQSGAVLGKTTPIQGMVGAGFSTRLSRNLTIGASGKFIYSDLASSYKSADGTSPLKAVAVIAMDFGLDYQRELKEDVILTAGISVSNLGNKVDYTNDGRFGFIPANVGIGVGVKRIVSNFHTFNIGIDLNKLLVPVRPFDTGDAIKTYYTQSVFQSWYNSFSDAKGGLVEELKEIIANVGFEYIYRNLFHGKIGYIYQNPIKGYSSMITLGMTFKYARFDFDIAYGIPTYGNSTYNTSPLANSLRLGIAYKVSDE